MISVRRSGRIVEQTVVIGMSSVGLAACTTSTAESATVSAIACGRAVELVFELEIRRGESRRGT